MEIINQECNKKTTNRWCCVPQCKYKRGASLHRFPKDSSLRKKWITALRIGNTVTSNMVVCGDHFKQEDFVPRFNIRRKTLKKKGVPSVNLPVRPSDKILSLEEKKQIDDRKQRWEKRQLYTSSSKKRSQQQGKDSLEAQDIAMNTEKDSATETQSAKKEVISDKLEEPEEMVRESLEESEEMVHELLEESKEMVDESQKYKNCESCTATDNENRDSDEEAAKEAARILLLLSEQSVKEKNIEIPRTTIMDQKIENGREKSLFMRLLTKTDDLKTFCGINSILLDNLVTAVKMCEKKPKQYKITIEERIVLCLCKLRLNLSFKCLAVLFQMERHTCSNIFLITLHTLAYILKDAIYWPSKDEILKSMPKCFDKFKDTYIVLDCTEIPVERPKCLQCRLRLYSHYKGCETIKFLVGISPSGLIIFISKPFGGRASDKAIFNHSKILEKLEPTRDAIMVDKGFAIETECAEARVKLIIPPKLGKNKQFSIENITSTVQIASARVHVERAIQRMKLFNILKSKISQKMVPYIAEVCTIICGLVNLSEPILANKRFQ